jgi:hypothetical protein
MKRKIDITFEIKTQVEIEVPDIIRLDNYICHHKKELTDIARKNLPTKEINKQLSWDNLIWCEHDNNEIDILNI